MTVPDCTMPSVLVVRYTGEHGTREHCQRYNKGHCSHVPTPNRNYLFTLPSSRFSFGLFSLSCSSEHFLLLTAQLPVPLLWELQSPCVWISPSCGAEWSHSGSSFTSQLRGFVLQSPLSHSPHLHPKSELDRPPL